MAYGYRYADIAFYKNKHLSVSFMLVINLWVIGSPREQMISGSIFDKNRNYRNNKARYNKGFEGFK